MSGFCGWRRTSDKRGGKIAVQQNPRSAVGGEVGAIRNPVTSGRKA